MFNIAAAWGSDNSWDKQEADQKNLKGNAEKWDVHRGFEKLSYFFGNLEDYVHV